MLTIGAFLLAIQAFLITVGKRVQETPQRTVSKEAQLQAKKIQLSTKASPKYFLMPLTGQLS